jgi:iron complex outermembrane recepter protein
MELGTSRRRYPQGGVSTLLMLLVACFCSSLARAGAPPTMHFDIPAGDAQKALVQFLTQTHIEMLYSSDDIRGVTTQAVVGELTVAQALRQMFDGTGLEVSFENDFMFASIKPAKKIETGPVTPPDLAAGVNTWELMRGRPDIPIRALADEPELEEVVVTGTLIHGVLDIMSPLQFITRNEMNRTSYATVQDALRSLTVSTGGGPSERINSAGNFTRGESANLRGLGAGATLVLIDGHRQPFSGAVGDFVDISNIAWSAVERIEVLPDGASALYGSDAIAGVVNVIMRKDLIGAETWARVGTASGGADEKLVAQLFGNSWESGRGLFSYQYAERSTLAAAQRAYAADADKRSFGGTDHRSFNSSPGNILDPATLEPAYGLPGIADGALGLADLGGVNRQNQFSTRQLLPDRRTHSFFVSGSQDLSEHLEVFAEGRYTKREIDQQLHAADQVLVVPGHNPFAVNPFPGSPFVFVGYSFLDALGPIVLHGKAQTYNGVLGLKSEVGETWRLTLSGSHGRENMNSATENLPDQIVLSEALAATDAATAFNPFGDASLNSPAVIDAIRSTQMDNARSSVTSTTFVADGTVFTIPQGHVKLAIGSEWRKEQFGNAISIGMPFAREVESAFAELSIPIVGSREDPWAVPRVELSLAGRYEDYSDFGSTWNPKVGVRWAPTKSVKMRTSWGTSFRAPRLTDLYDTAHNIALLAPLKDPRSPTGSSIALAFQGNNPNLRQETATTWSAGIDLAIAQTPGSTLSLTYYSIDYTGRILTPGLSSPADILLNEDHWADVITRNPSLAEIEAICDRSEFIGNVAQCKSAPVAAIVNFDWRNLATTRVRGLDLKLDQQVDTSLGFLQFGLSGNYVFKFDEAVSSTSPMVDVVDTVGNPLGFRVRGSVEWYQRSWDQPGLGLNLTADHTGGYKDIQSDLTTKVADFTTIDFRLSYKTPKVGGPLSDVHLILNATNVFDQAPPFVDREDGYDVINNVPYGRVVSFSIQKKW